MQEQSLKVLLIENDEAFAHSVRTMLESAREIVGTITIVNSLVGAVQKLSEESFNVILLEFFLPDGAGLLNIALLKERAPRVPVIVVGAEEDETLAVEAVHAGAQDYLVKGTLKLRWLTRAIRYAVERNEADLALLAAEEKYRGIFDHLVEGIFQTTPDGHYHMANAALARIYGYASPEELQQSVTDIGRTLYVQPGRREEFRRTMEQHDTITGFESEIYRKDGTKIWISENCRAIRDAQGRLLYYEGTVEDITLRRAAEQEVRNSESLYHSLVETMPQNVFRKDRQGRFTFANRQYCRHYNCELKDILGKTDFDFFPKDLAEQYHIDDERVMTTGESREIVEVHHPLGQEKSITQVVKTPLYGADGSIVGLQGIFWDVTKERRMAEDLRNSEALYHSLVETIPQNIFRKDLQGNFTFANQQFCRTLNRTLEDIVGKTDFDFFPKELAQKYQADDHRIVESGETFATVEENKPPGQSTIYVQVVKTPLRDANGKIIGLQGMFWDITKERQMADDLRSSEALYHSLVETLPQNIYRKDMRGRYTFANPQYCKTLGRKLEDVIGNTIFDFLPRELAEKRTLDDRRVFETGEVFQTVEENKFAGGENTYIQVFKVPMFDASGKISGLQCMFWDITEERRAAERVRKANAELARSREELRVKNEEMEADLKTAREIQVALLPRDATSAQSAFHFAHRYLPAGTVGGDFFSILNLSDTETAVFICDVAGHGVRSALVTAMIRALVEELRPLAHNPGEFMTKLNSDLHAILKHAGTPLLTTAFYLVANSATGVMRYANAGHPKPLHVRRHAGQVELLQNATKRSQTALGLFPKSVYLTSETTLTASDLIVLFTDGVYDVQSKKDELYTQEMLAAAVQKRLALPAGKLFDALLKEIKTFAVQHEFVDDVCLVGMEFAGSAKSP